MKTAFGKLALTLAGLMVAATVQAQTPRSPTLDKIAASGTIYLGYREAALPFSYLNGQDAPRGYSIELCQHVVEAVKRRLGRTQLNVVYVPVSTGSRQMLLETGTVDLECGAATNTLQRQRYVGFSVTTFVAGVKTLVRKDTGIRSLDDLRGKVVLTDPGTSSEAALRSAALRQGLGLTYRAGRDPEDALQQVLDGRAEAMVFDEVQLKALLLGRDAAEVARLMMLDDSMAAEPYALVFKRNDPGFKSLVDATLVDLMQRGELARIYERWFVAPIPPSGRSLELPMSELLKQLIETPNDRGV